MQAQRVTETDPLVVVDEQAAKPEEGTTGIVVGDEEFGKTYQSERVLKHKGNKTVNCLRTFLYVAWGVYILTLEGLAVTEFTLLPYGNVLNALQNTPNSDQTTPSLLGKLVWLILISCAAAGAFIWWLFGLIAACGNCCAVIDPTSTELPYAPLIFKVSWATIQLLMWLIVEGATVVIWILQNDFSNVVQTGAFLAQMLLVLLFGIFTTFSIVLQNARMTCDGCLRCCHSPCYDL